MLAGVTVERDLACRAPDGTALRADVYRPEGTGPRPVLLLRLPYGKHAADSDVAFAHPAWLAAQGFLVVVQDTRGRWSSGGSFYPFRDEAADGKATVRLTRLDASHAFANIALTDNVVRFATRRYCDNPLIVQGPGAGPEVTAGGVFSDVLRLSAYLGAHL